MRLRALRRGGLAVLLSCVLGILLAGTAHDVVHHDDGHGGGDCALCVTPTAEPPAAEPLPVPFRHVEPRREAPWTAPDTRTPWRREVERGPPAGRA